MPSLIGISNGSLFMFAGSMVESSSRGTSCHAYSSHRTNKKCDDQTVYHEGPLSLLIVGSFLSFVVTMKQVVSLGLGSKHRRILFFEKFHVSH